MKISSCLSAAVLAASFATVFPAAAQSAAEARLRDQLRQTTLDLRASQDENSELKQRLSAVPETKAAPAIATKPATDAADSARTRRAEAALRAQSSQTTTLQKQLDDARKALDQWQQSYNQAVLLARSRDADAKKFEADAQTLGEHAQRCERDNTQLVAISDELLMRYKNKSAWRALGDDEPLTGLQRVQLEKISQDYHARIVDATVAPPASPGAPQ